MRYRRTGLPSAGLNGRSLAFHRICDSGVLTPYDISPSKDLCIGNCNFEKMLSPQLLVSQPGNVAGRRSCWICAWPSLMLWMCFALQSLVQVMLLLQSMGCLRISEQINLYWHLLHSHPKKEATPDSEMCIDFKIQKDPIDKMVEKENNWNGNNI